MQPKIVFRNKAVKEIEDAYHWYESQKTGLGDLFIESIDFAVVAITKSPNAYQFIYKKYHHFPLKKFPFVVVYKVYASEIVVFGVFHTKRNPQNKYE